MTARPGPIAGTFLLGIGLWAAAALLGLFAAAINSPFGGGFPVLELLARVACLATAILCLWAIVRTANAARSAETATN